MNKEHRYTYQEYRCLLWITTIQTMTDVWGSTPASLYPPMPKDSWRVTLEAQKKVDEKRKAERQAAKWLDIQPTKKGI